jgi:hypothetical protein
MGYFDLKKQVSSGTQTASKSSYFALKQKVSPIIESLQQQDEQKKKKLLMEEAVKNAEIAKQEAEKAGSVWGIAKETAKGVGKTLLDFGKEAIRFPLTAPLKVVQSLTEAATGKPQIYTPETGIEKFVYGDQPRQSYQQDQEAIQKWGEEKGLGKKSAIGLGALGAGAEVAADLVIPGTATKIFKSSIGKSILSKMGVKSAKVVEAVSKGTTTEKEIVDIFQENGLKGVEELVAEPKVLKSGELAPVVKEIETQTGKKFKPSEALQVKADLEKGISKEAIINDIVEPPKAPKLTPEASKPEIGVKTPVKEKVVIDPLIQEARKESYGTVKEWGTRNQYVANNPYRSQLDAMLKTKKFDKEVLKDAERWEMQQVLKDKPAFLSNNLSKEEISDFAKKNGLWFRSHGEDMVVAKDIDSLNRTLNALDVGKGGQRELGLSLGYEDIGMPKKVKSQPLQEGVDKVAKEIPKVELTPSKVAKSIEAKSVEEKLTKGFGDVAGYEKITIKDQAQKTTKLLDEEFDNAVKMIKGEIPVKEGIKPEMLIKTMEDYAQAKGDVNLLRELAKSPLVSETSAHAQALRILAERNPESALVNIQKIAKERATSFERKSGKSVDKATKEITEEIKVKAKQKIPTKQDWDNFINEIKC